MPGFGVNVTPKSRKVCIVLCPTGGAGSGKSTVSDMLRTLGAVVIVLLRAAGEHEEKHI